MAIHMKKNVTNQCKKFVEHLNIIYLLKKTHFWVTIQDYNK